MAASSEEIAESLNKCVKNLATAEEALQNLRNRTGNQISESRLSMVKRPTELDEPETECIDGGTRGNFRAWRW